MSILLNWRWTLYLRWIVNKLSCKLKSKRCTWENGMDKCNINLVTLILIQLCVMLRTIIMSIWFRWRWNEIIYFWFWRERSIKVHFNISAGFILVHVAMADGHQRRWHRLSPLVSSRAARQHCKRNQIINNVSEHTSKYLILNLPPVSDVTPPVGVSHGVYLLLIQLTWLSASLYSVYPAWVSAKVDRCCSELAITIWGNSRNTFTLIF